MTIRERLLAEGCPENVVNNIAARLEHVSPALKNLVDRWAEEGQENSYEAEGYSIESIMKRLGVKYPSAVLTMDWLLRDPEQAKKAIAYGRR